MRHPQPTGAFAWVQAPPGAALVCRALEPLARHLFTTREWTLGSAADSVPAGTEVPIDESFSGLVFKTQKPLIVPDFAKETRFPTTAHLRPAGVQSFCMFPLTTPLRRLGAIAFGSSTIDLFKESELDYLGMVADQVAVAVDNVLHHEAAQSAERQLRRERDRLRLLLDVNRAG